MSLEEAQAAVSFPLIRPQDALANDASIRAVFVEIVPNNDTGKAAEQVGIDYESGIRLILTRADLDGFDVDPRAQYEGMALGIPGAEVKTVQGVAALVIPRGPAPGEPNLGGAVDLTLDGVRILMIAQYAPLEADLLVQAAATLEVGES